MKYTVLALALLVPSLCLNALETVIHPVETVIDIAEEREEPDMMELRQQIEGAFTEGEAEGTIVIRIGRDPKGVLPSYLHWMPAEALGPYISKSYAEQKMVVTYGGETIFDSDEHPFYSHMSLEGLCRDQQAQQRLVFHLLQEGSGNGHIDDRLFIYYDPVTASFRSEIVESRFLPSDACDLEKALLRKARYLEGEQELSEIYAQLRPAEMPTQLAAYLPGKVVPAKSLENERFYRLLERFRQFVGGDIVGGERLDYGCEINTRAANGSWSIAEMIHNGYDPGESWGVLLLQEKETKRWSAFYDMASGGSKLPLHVPQELELVGDRLRGSFCTDCDPGLGSYKDFEIELSTLQVYPTHAFRFFDYPAERYDGPVADLNLSDETAGMFPTRIRAQLAEGPNFAGHYAITEAGCGTECQLIIVTDVITGRVVESRITRLGAEYLVDSLLLILNPEPECLDGELCRQEFYLMDGGGLRSVKGE